MESFILFVATYSELLKGITVFVTTATALYFGGRKLYANVKKFLKKELDARFESLNTSIADLTKSSIDQMEKINQLIDREDHSAKTDKHILRSLITAKYYTYMAEQSLPMYERECIMLLYSDYKALNGNTFIDSLYNQLMTLPSEELELAPGK